MMPALAFSAPSNTNPGQSYSWFFDYRRGRINACIVNYSNAGANSTSLLTVGVLSCFILAGFCAYQLLFKSKRDLLQGIGVNTVNQRSVKLVIEYSGRSRKPAQRKVLQLSSTLMRRTSSNVSSCGCDSSGSEKRKITIVPYVPPSKKSHDDKNMSLKRPMSPHLTIYAPTLPAMTSIVQRITGVVLTFYALLLSNGSLFLSNGVETYVSMIQSLDLSRPSILIIKLILGAPFVYHYFNGIRFCMWNAGRWLAMKDVYETARKSFIATAVVTLLFALL